MQNEPVAAVKFFVVWCFQDRLQPLHTNATVIERKQHKNKLMDLWLFCARYDIPKLQNLALQALYTLFPQLLEKEDIKYAWARSPFGASGLKWLVVYAMVAKIEEGNANIDSYAELAGEEGFMVMVYEALKQWASCDMPKTPKKGRAKTKWMVMCESEDVREVLLVDEATKPTPATPKRSAPESGGGSSAKKARGFKGMPQGAMIDLTDD